MPSGSGCRETAWDGPVGPRRPLAGLEGGAELQGLSPGSLRPDSLPGPVLQVLSAPMTQVRTHRGWLNSGASWTPAHTPHPSVAICESPPLVL